MAGRHLERIALGPGVQRRDEGAEPVDHRARLADDGAHLERGGVHGLLVHRHQQMLLALERLVEAAERLLRTLHDLLHREVESALLVDQVGRGVEEPLHPMLHPHSGGVERAGHRLVSPGQDGRIGSGVARNGPVRVIP